MDTGGTMGMGAYDESEQNRREEAKQVDEDQTEQITTDQYDGDVSYDTPETADVLMENFKRGQDET
ncbi:MAG: DUF5786 family protein [Halobacteriales archaeon]